MNQGNILIIDQNYFKNEISFFLKRHEGGKTVFTGRDGENIIEYRTDPHEILKEDMKPFLTLPGPLAREFISLIADYANKNEIKTENTNVLQGKFEMISKHYQDMKDHYNDMKKIANKCITITIQEAK